MPKYAFVKLFRKCFITEDLDEDLISNDRESWMNKLDYFRSKLGMKKKTKKINGKDIAFNVILELFSDQAMTMELNALVINCTNSDIEMFIPQLCHYIIKEGRYSDAVEKFILQRASNSPNFAHQILWNFLQGLEMGGETIPMKTLQFLQTLTE